MGLQTIFNLRSLEEVGQKLKRDYVDNQGDKARREIARKRDELYAGKGDGYIMSLVDKAFTDPLTKKLRKDLIGWAKWNKFLARLVREKATVYSEPTTRRVADRDEAYQLFVKRCRMDATMRECNRKLVLHEEVWVQYRVRETPRGREPVVDVISPSQFMAVAHPGDPTMLVAIIIDQRPGGDVAKLDPTTPAYRVLVDDETFMLDAAGRAMSGSYKAWPYKRLCGVLASIVPPAAKGALLSDCANEDLVAAHESIWFVNLLGLKEIKSANKQTYASGDTSRATMGQPADTETETVLPEGVTIQAIDRGMDTNQFGAMSTRIGDEAGANHGIPPSVRHQRDASSGAEIFLRTLPIRALRLEQVPIMREVESEIFHVQMLVNATELTDQVYAVEGWSADFGEVQQPLTTAERNATFKEERGLFLTNTIAEIMARNPDLTEAQAKEFLERNEQIEQERIERVQAIAKTNGSHKGTPEDLARPPGAKKPETDEDGNPVAEASGAAAGELGGKVDEQ